MLLLGGILIDCRRFLFSFHILKGERKTNEYVWQHVSILAGRHELLLSTVKRRKLSWFRHVCYHDTLPKILVHGSVDAGRRRGRPRKS